MRSRERFLLGAWSLIVIVAAVVSHHVNERMAHASGYSHRFGPEWVERWAMGGGGMLHGNSLSAHVTVGQHGAVTEDEAGPITAGVGFWPAAPPAITFPCPADIAPPGGDGAVNVNDLLAVINGWGACPAPCPPSCNADINDDCMVNVNDLLAVINAWGSCP
jgi:hypothetical protein